MLSSENHKLQAALGHLEACASLYANASDDPAMKAQIQLQTDRVRKALVATQAEARELRAEMSSWRELHAVIIGGFMSANKLWPNEWPQDVAAAAFAIYQLHQLAMCGCGDGFTRDSPGECDNCCAAERATQDLEIDRLEDELARVRGLLNVARCPNCDGSGAIPHGPTPDGDWEWQQCQWCGERAALSQPAEQVDPDDNRHLRMILHAYETGVGHGQQGRGATHDQWGNNELTYAYQQGVRQGEKGKSAAEQPSQEPDLPLMARQDWMDDAIGVMREDPGRQDWQLYYENDQVLMLQDAAAGLEVYRVADTDEHGLPVVERTAETPKGAKYRYYHAKRIGVYYAKEYYPATPRHDWRRFEDYNAHAERAALSQMPTEGSQS